MIPGGLINAWFKTERAKKHLNDLDEALGQYFDADKKPYSVSVENDRQHATFTLRVEIEEPHVWLFLIAGDVFSCLRSALDHAIWRIASLHVAEPKENIQFPVIALDDKRGRKLFQKQTAGLPDEVVAVIESPEIDQQYAAAVTDLEHKRRNLARSQELFAKGNTTQVAMFQFETDARVAEANVKGLETMKGYQIIRAPFAGRVTARFVDPGGLITNAQTNMVSALPIMTISDDSRLRVYCYVQQQDVPFINVGDVADVIDASNPERRMAAKISRMTGELETRTRTMQIEINIDNTEGFLVAGSFANVTVHIPIKSYPQIPVSGLLIRGADSFVAMVENDKLAYKKVRIASTDGNTVTVAEGLRQGDRIAINLPDEVTEGSKVQPILKN